ncbi:protein of unknown function [Kyrpidia spormannii]|uniref:Uncharacterized protein n=1 Tax=Kyrpidia spormannii TaxID=2055160 RepID=A0A6F9EGX1_9BACL|nr:protein of unknown function [Kyrpidia spormannii]
MLIFMNNDLSNTFLAVNHDRQPRVVGDNNYRK